jgi:hypothetical protein
LYDALAEIASAATNPDTVLVVITDGEDNASRHSAEQTVDQFLKNRWPPVFGLVLDYDLPEHRRREQLKKIATRTGGGVLYPSSKANVAETTSELSDEINAPLTIVLQPSQPILKPEKLKLELTEGDGKPMHGIQIAHPSEITACDATPSPSAKPQ